MWIREDAIPFLISKLRNFSVSKLVVGNLAVVGKLLDLMKR